MSLTDPTAGLGYAFGTVLSSSHMTTIATQQPRAIDGESGGTYTPSAAINIQDSDGFALGTIHHKGTDTWRSGSLAVFSAGSTLAWPPGSLIANTDNQTLDPANGLAQEFASPTAARAHDLVSPGQSGRFFLLIRTSTGAFDITIRRSGFSGAAIVVLPTSVWAAALLRADASNWRLALHASATPGADA